MAHNAPPLSKRNSLSIGWGIAAALIFCLACFIPNLTSSEITNTMIVTVGMSVSGFILTSALIPSFGDSLMKAGLKGKDLNKPEKHAKEIPESLGVVVGTVYLMSVILFQASQAFFLPAVHSLAEYNAALTSICFMIFLGFADDVLDLRWRYKLVLPLVASLPLLVAYSGPTSILVPRPFVSWFGESIELGFVFHVYVSMLTIFCTNSINIYAGINGLEAGQSFVISCFILLYNFLKIALGDEGPSGNHRHFFSISLMMPFAATTLALLRFNWYPSRVFVGDCFTYFAGMTFAVVGILSHFPKTLILFFIPQILNFVMSLPQLLKIVPCPRHRLPKLNPQTGLLDPTYNFNLVNAFLYVFGSMTEEQLCRVCLLFQVACCSLALVLRLLLEQVL
eukprot:c7845_g1_i2.p1 GENE.c7845_g1_i2~~c7845_g1_i2.p1  ORF type:complete len:401 (+),score=96.99 c7845_g1_i2:23-1204(+)